MSTLQKKLAEYGFESNDDYQYHLKSFFSSPIQDIRLLLIEGDQQRRKTAFANALALSLDYPHFLYYDFSQQDDMENKVKLPPTQHEEGLEPPAISDFDHIMSEACAYSEADDCVLILDQLHLTDFKNHIRLYHFIKNYQWSYNQISMQANPNKLVVFLISNEPIYHSLQKSGFRVWVNTISDKHVIYNAEELGLDEQATLLIKALDELFISMGLSPTFSEYQKIIHDIQHNIKTEEHLLLSIFGWTEGIDRELLYSEKIKPLVSKVIIELHKYWGIDEVIIE